MKYFLITSTFLMIAAGIYGAFDLSMDIRNGTLIQYDNESETQAAEFFSGKNPSVSKSNTIHVAQKVEKKKEKPALVNSFFNLEISDFSRAMPPMDYNALLLDNLAQPDSLKNEDVAAAINDTLTAISENKSARATDSLAPAKEERRFKFALYSRGKPRTVSRTAVDTIHSSTQK